MTRLTKIAAAMLTAAVLSTTGPASAQTQPVQARDLSLAEALTMAAQQNQQLRIAAFEVAVARSQLAQARAGTAPQVNAQASYTRTQGQGPTTISLGGVTVEIPAPSPNLYDVRILLQYPLFTGGRLEAQIALAEANLKGAEASLERLKQQVVFSVRQAYYQLLLAQSGLEVADRGAAQAAENLRVARARVAAGVSPRFDEVQADVAVAQARQSQVRSRNAIAQAAQGLNALINLPLNTPLRLRDALAIRPVGPPVDALVARALEARPEFAELRARQGAAQAGIALAESGAKPTVALSAGGSYGNTSGGFIPGAGASSSWSITLAATLNLYDGGLTRERIQEARLRLEQLRASEALQRQTVELEVRQAALTLQSVAEELAGADAVVTQAAEALRIANVRFQAGVGTNLEVLAAQTTASQAEAARVQALYSYNVARAALERAVGADLP